MSEMDKDAKAGSQMGFLIENLSNVFTRALKYTELAAGGVSPNLFFKNPVNFDMMVKAGNALKDMRETAGLSLDELAAAVKTDNPGILKSIEEGRAALPIDLMLRLASFYSRNDPLPFIIRFSRTYHPGLNSVLEKTGIDRLLIEAERELKFINIYRNTDKARKLPDESFDRVLEFTRKAFEMALHFAFEQENNKPA